MKQFTTYILLFISTIGFSQSDIVKAETDTTNIRIGEQFIYKISVDGTKNVIIPKLELKNLEVVDSLKTDTIKDKIIKKYVLTGFDSGAFYIPQQQIFVRNQAHLTDSLLINVATIAVDTTKIKKYAIKGIKSEPYQFNDFRNYIYWIIGALILIGLLLYFFVFKKKKQEEIKEIIPILSPFEEAIQRLNTLDGKLLWQNNKIKQYYSELTDIVRDYLGRDIGIPTLELTSNEIVDLVSVQNEGKKLGVSKQTISNIDKLLRNADLVKFAKLKPMAENIELDRKTAEQIINTIKPKIEKHKEILLAENPELAKEIDSENSVIPKNQNFKKTKNSWLSDKKNQATIGFIVGLLILLPIGFFVGGKVSNFISKNFDTTTTEKLVKKEWKSYTLGNPSITFESPVEIPKEKMGNVIPDEAKQYINSIDGYNYQSFVNNLQIAFVSSIYIPQIQADLNGAINGAITKIQQQPDVSDFKYEVEQFDKFNAKSALLNGSFNEKNNTKRFKCLVIAQKNTIRIIVISHKVGDENGKKICNRIINSITIENAE